MKGLLLLVTLLAYSTRLSNVEANDSFPSTFSYKTDAANGNFTTLEKWQILEKKFKEIANAGVKMVLPFLMDNSAKMNLSKECMKTSMHLLSGVKNIKSWAMRFVDSSGKIIDGLVEGTMSSLGAYDECVDTVVHSTRLRDQGQLLYRGQYCTINMKPPLPDESIHNIHGMVEELKNFSQTDSVVAEMAKNAHISHYFSLRIGICVPSGCTVEDVDKVARTLGDALMFSAKASRCEVKEENNFTPLIIALMSCYSFAGFLVLVGSLIDIYAQYKKINFKNTFIRVLVAFSFFSNFRKFVSTETSSDTLSCLNGVRFLCMTWIILSHTYLIVNFHLLFSIIKVRDILKSFPFQVVLNGTFAVDTFFFIGALLVSYLSIKLVRERGGKFNVGLFIFHRLFRIIPVYAFVIMFMFFFDLMGSGPVWHDTIHRYTEACYKNWWTNLIFISNFYDAEHMCVPHSWYLASDFQLYVGALAILLPLMRRPKVGILLSFIGIIASIIYGGVVTYVNDYPFAMLATDPDLEKIHVFLAHFYFRPFIHASPYCIGLLSGYLLATKPDLRIPPFIQVIGWIMAFVCSFSTLYGIVEWNRGIEPSFWVGILYASLSRTSWTLGVAWMIICCATGHGGIINHILSWKVFVPLGRLTYVAYLAHLLVQLLYMGNVRTQIHPAHFVAVWLFFGHLCVTYGVAFAGSMLIEAPFLTLEKIFLRREKESANNPPLKGSFDLNGRFKSEKNDFNGIITKSDEESGGIDNRCAEYRL